MPTSLSTDSFKAEIDSHQSPINSPWCHEGPENQFLHTDHLAAGVALWNGCDRLMNQDLPGACNIDGHFGWSELKKLFIPINHLMLLSNVLFLVALNQQHHPPSILNIISRWDLSAIFLIFSGHIRAVENLLDQLSSCNVYTHDCHDHDHKMSRNSCKAKRLW